MKPLFRFLSLIGSLLLLLSLILPLAAQENPLPAPTGPYQVGVTSLTLTDEARDEVFTSDPSDSRAITLWVWYPADIASGATPASYLDGFDIEQSGFELTVASYGGNVDQTREALDSLQRYAFQDAPVSNIEDSYPVVIDSNILSGLPIMQSLQFEELARFC